MKLEGQRQVARRRRSLPTRERELKHLRRGAVVAQVESLPTRERELKHLRRGAVVAQVESLPTRERELKHDYWEFLENGGDVAPYTGA